MCLLVPNSRLLWFGMVNSKMEFGLWEVFCQQNRWLCQQKDGILQKHAVKVPTTWQQTINSVNKNDNFANKNNGFAIKTIIWRKKHQLNTLNCCGRTHHENCLKKMTDYFHCNGNNKMWSVPGAMLIVPHPMLKTRSMFDHGRVSG